MREEITTLIQLGPFPDETDAAPEIVDQYTDLLDRISPPVSLEEAKTLATLFGKDDFFGLAWSLIHLIESAPGWSIEVLEDMNKNNIWISLLKDRLETH